MYENLAYPIQIRKATNDDIPPILQLVEMYKFNQDGSGFLLHLEECSISRLVNSGSFFVAYIGEHLAGNVSIAEYSGIAELRSLAVHPKYQSHGIGSRLIQKCKEEASMRGYSELYAFTNPEAYSTFQKYDFNIIETPPEKLAEDCINCPLHNNGKCKEQAVVAFLNKL